MSFDLVCKPKGEIPPEYEKPLEGRWSETDIPVGARRAPSSFRIYPAMFVIRGHILEPYSRKKGPYLEPRPTGLNWMSKAAHSVPPKT
jgi:hypothetical protein